MANEHDRTGNTASTWPRRTVLKALSVVGVGSVVFGRALVGRLFGEEAMLAAAWAYQRATDFHLAHPPLPEGPHE
jgi:hypothetical protein